MELQGTGWIWEELGGTEWIWVELGGSGKNWVELGGTTPNSKEEIENARGFFFQEILRGRGINAYQNSIFCLSFLDKVLPIREVA